MENIAELTVGQIITILSSAGVGVVGWKIIKSAWKAFSGVFNKKGFIDMFPEEKEGEKAKDETTSLTLGRYLTLHTETCKSNLAPIYNDMLWIKKDAEESREYTKECMGEIKEMVSTTVKHFNETAVRIESRIDNLIMSRGAR